MKNILALIIASMCLAALPADNAYAELNVVTSIKPINSLVASVMKDVGKPKLIIEGAASPHDYALKPSQAAALENADLIFWVGHELERFLEKPLSTIGSDAKSVELIEIKDLIVFEFRANELAENEEDPHHDDTHSQEHDEHHHEGRDPHVWLHPQNAKTLVSAIEKALANQDPANAEIYRANAQATQVRIDQLAEEVRTLLAPVRDKDYIVFHDAYQYFENHVGLAPVASITVSPEVLPGAARIRTIRQKVKSTNPACVFSEPQFEPRLIETIIEGTDVKSATLDPLGAEIPDGPELYGKLLRKLATSMKDCLSE
ncbi:MAG: zinc ABC transporter substrate-binding protein ZnuA [Rhizobiaceae bacterium]